MLNHRKKYTLFILYFVLFLLKIDVGFSQQVVGPCNGQVVYVDEDGQCDNDPYVLVFEDQFADNALDKSKWTAMVGTHGPPAQEQEYYVANNVVVEAPLGLYLWITNQGVTDPVTQDYYPYSSGEIQSNFVFGYGVYAINCEVPPKDGLWPAFWAHNGDPDQEIDGFEFYDDGFFTDPNQQTPRFNDINNDNNADCPWPQSRSQDPPFSTNYHTFDFSYDNYAIEWSVDGYPIRYSTKFSNILSQPILCDALEVADNPYIRANEFPFPPLAITANVAVSGGTYGPSGWSDNYVMAIRYIDYYQQIPCPAGDVTVNESDLNSDPNFFNVFLGSNITVAGDVDIPNNGALELIASNSIVLQPGFTSGGYFVGQINNDPCNGIHSPIRNYKTQSNPSDSTKGIIAKTDIFDFNIYPIPAINSATISFNLPSQNTVVIELDDILGHQILNVLNESNLSSGSHQQIINVSNLSPGVYICIIRSGDYTEQRKLIVEKP